MATFIALKLAGASWRPLKPFWSATPLAAEWIDIKKIFWSIPFLIAFSLFHSWLQIVSLPLHCACLWPTSLSNQFSNWNSSPVCKIWICDWYLSSSFSNRILLLALVMFVSSVMLFRKTHCVWICFSGWPMSVWPILHQTDMNKVATCQPAPICLASQDALEVMGVSHWVTGR